MAIWDNVAASIADNGRQPLPSDQEAIDRYNHQYQLSVAECRPSHLRIQALVDDYLSRNPPNWGSDIYLVQLDGTKSIDLVFEVHKDRSWILWHQDRLGHFKYLTSESIIELEQKGSIADRQSLPPFPGAQFQVAEQRISTALYKDLRRHGLI